MKDKDINDTIEKYWTGKAKELKFHGPHKGSVVKMANVDDATVEYITPNGPVKIQASPGYVKSLGEVKVGGSWTASIEPYPSAYTVSLTTTYALDLEFLKNYEGCTTQLARMISQTLAHGIGQQVLEYIKAARQQDKWEEVK